MVKVQQQNGIDDCGAFACAIAYLLCQRKDPSQYNFNQKLMRAEFDKVYNEAAAPFFQSFNYNACAVDITNINLNWGFKCVDKQAQQMESGRNRRANNLITMQPVYTL